MIRVVCQGLGLIGQEIARVAAAHPGLSLVGAVDVAPGLQGKRLRDLSARIDSDVTIRGDAEDVLRETKPDVVLLSTTSNAQAVAAQAAVFLSYGAAVVTTCEELAYPWGRPGADELHRAACAAGRGVLATGVNPGFVMDLLPAVLSAASVGVTAVEIERTVDLRRRRPALQKKAGVGMTLDAFRLAMERQAIGHVGLDCSARLIAAALGPDRGWPIVHMKPLAPDGRNVVGFVQTAGYDAEGDAPAVTLRLEMSSELHKPEQDSIVIKGTPQISAVIEGGVFGDTATAAVVINSIPAVLASSGGLHTVLDLPAPHAWRQGS